MTQPRYQVRSISEYGAFSRREAKSWLVLDTAPSIGYRLVWHSYLTGHATEQRKAEQIAARLNAQDEAYRAGSR